MTKMKKMIQNEQIEDDSLNEFEKFIHNFNNIDEIVDNFQEKITNYRKEIENDSRTNELLLSKYELQTKRKQLLEKIEKTKSLRHELESMIDNEYVKKFLDYHGECQKHKIIYDQIQSLNQFENLYKNIENSLEESMNLLKNENKFDNSYDLLESIKNDFYKKLLNDFETLFNDKSKIKISAYQKEMLENSIKKIDQKIKMTKEKFIAYMIEIFKNNIYFDESDSTILYFGFPKSMSFEQYESYINCIMNDKYDYIFHVKFLFEQLNENFLRNILENNKTIENHEYEIHLIDNNNNDNEMDKVIENVENFIETILNKFTFDNRIKQCDIFRKFLGQFWCEQIIKCIINYYFERLLPKSEAELDEFIDKILKQKGDQIVKKIQSLGMIVDNDDGEQFKTLKLYQENIHKHFLTRLCQNFLTQMKMSLREPKESVSSEKLLSNFALKSKSKFANCQCSDYMISVKELLEEMSALLSNCSKNLSLMLTETIDLSCELFITISPYKYRELIETNAKENAIFHNNCLLFGHFIECLIITHKPLLDSLLAELIPNIKNIGSKILLNQMRYHERKLLNFINNETFEKSLQDICNETPKTDLRLSSQSHYEFRECLNNCLKYINYLCNSFMNVLPEKIYNKIWSTLLLIVFNQFIKQLLLLDDISSLGSSHLYNEIDYFCKEMKLFLIDSEDVIFKWMKLNEINFLLKSSLLEILNRWADGHGLLATYLEPDEVKHLIRALFQNNERRAKVLAKIK